jgi:hypothetical protein
MTSPNDYLINVIDNLVELVEPQTDYVYMLLHVIPSFYPHTNIQFTYPPRIRKIAKQPLPLNCNEFLIPFLPDLTDITATVYTLHESSIVFTTHTTPYRYHIDVLLAHTKLAPDRLHTKLHPYLHAYRVIKTVTD